MEYAFYRYHQSSCSARWQLGYWHDNLPSVPVFHAPDNAMFPPDHGWDCISDKQDYDPPTVCRPVGQQPTGSTQAVTTSNDGAAADAPSSSNVNQIIVEGCGSSHDNGRYHRLVRLVGVTHNDAGVYIKQQRGLWPSAIYRGKYLGACRWLVGSWIENENAPLPVLSYYSLENANCLPSENGYFATTSGKQPAPNRCRMIISNGSCRSNLTSYTADYSSCIACKSSS